jgi:hypothetical protein
MLADEIEKIVYQLLELRLVSTPEEIKALTEFDAFREQNRLFYDLILSGQFEEPVFKQMMAMKRRIESKELNNYEADVRFGQYMAEKYIDPVIKKA